MSILKGLTNKTKLTIYKTFGGEVKFKRYLNGVGDARTRLLFKLSSGTHGLNEELGRHRGSVIIIIIIISPCYYNNNYI